VLSLVEEARTGAEDFLKMGPAGRELDVLFLSPTHAMRDGVQRTSGSVTVYSHNYSLNKKSMIIPYLAICTLQETTHLHAVTETMTNRTRSHRYLSTRRGSYGTC
jgi:hypothetical protein